MNVVIAVLYETDRLQSAELRWPLRIALQHGGEITFVVPATEEATTTRKLDLSEGGENDPLTSELAASLRAFLNQELTPEGWFVSAREASTEAEAEATEQAGALIRVALRSVPTEQIVSVARSLVADAREDLLVAVVEKLPREFTVWRRILREMLQGAVCQFVCVLPGEREADGEILFQPLHGQYVHVATPLAMALAQRHNRKATGLWVEPEIGPDAEQVGRQMLDRELSSALGDEAGQVVRRVEVEDSPERGILQACADERYEVFIRGVSRPSGNGFAEGQLPLRISRGTNQPTLVFTHAAMPLRTRLQRFMNSRLRRRVPQLEREERTDLVARVQSSSE